MTKIRDSKISDSKISDSKIRDSRISDPHLFIHDLNYVNFQDLQSLQKNPKL